MDLVRPALVALGVWIAGSVVAALVVAAWAGTGQLQSSTGRVLWAVIPQFLVGAATATAAAYAHRRPERDAPGRHALAVLVPAGVLFVVQALLNLLGSTQLWATGAAFGAEAFGAASGWLLVSRVLRRAERAETSGRYF